MMGSEVDKILQFFALSEEQKDDYSMVLNHFEHHSVKIKNAIYERAKFNQRSQWDGEEVDSFITALYGVAEHVVRVQRHVMHYQYHLFVVSSFTEFE